MMRFSTSAIAAGCVALVVTAQAQRQKPLEIYYLDMEGGGGTLFVAPSGESMLVDNGNPGGRDGKRVLAAAKEAGLGQIDYFVATHYHVDHYGGTAVAAAGIPIRNFVDSGENVDVGAVANPQELYDAYTQARQQGRHIVAKVGDKIPIKGLDVTVVTSGGATLTAPLSGGGAVNSLCRDFTPLTPTGTWLQDSTSIGIHVRYERFRELQLGDLPWNWEHKLACPNNLLGEVDVLQTSTHGLNLSGSKAFVHALRPRAVVINNGPRKGSTSDTLATVRSTPGFEDVWLVHAAVVRPTVGPEVNPPLPFIANVDEHADDAPARAADVPGYAIRISVRQDGTFTVLNPRTGYSKEYKTR